MTDSQTPPQSIDAVAALAKGLVFAAAAFRDDHPGLRAIVDAMALPMAICSRDLRYRWVSAGYALFLQRPAGEVIGQPIRDIIGQDAFDSLKSRFEQVLAGEYVDYQERIPHAGPSWRWVRAMYAPTFGSDGVAEGWVSIVLDIDKEYRALEALRESERQLRALTDAAPLFLYKILPDLKTEYLTHYFYEFTGLPHRRVSILPSDDNDLPLASVVHPDDIADVERLWRAAAAGDAQVSFEVRVRRADGAYRWFSARAQPELDEHGKLACLYGGAVEIHAQRMAVEALREADRRKDEYIAMLAHELRNPLSAIATSAQLITLRGRDNPQLARAAEIVTRQSDSLTRMVDALLDVSRITSGSIELKRVPADLRLIAEQAVETVRASVLARRQNLEIVLPDDAVSVLGDPTRLAQIITNLLNNATAYSPQDANIRLAVRREGNHAVVRVRDDGRGISDDLLPYIFDLFAQAKRSLDRSQGGLGIGLSVVRKLTELHGGTVEATSGGLNKGSEFVVRLPYLKDRLSSAETEKAPAVGAPPVSKVLVVDDNVDWAEGMAELLGEYGFDAIVAPDPYAALERFRLHRPAIVLLDIGLPDMDGWTLAGKLRELPEGRGVTLIAVTGYGQPSDLARSHQAGIDHHLVKPVSLDRLLKLMSGSAA